MRRSSEQGAILILAMGLAVALWFMAALFASHAMQSVQLARAGVASERALWAAEAGVTIGLQQLRSNPTYTGSKSFVRMASTRDTYRVEVFRDSSPSPPVPIPAGMVYVRATGREVTGTTRQVGVMVKVAAASNPMLYAIYGDQVTMSGNGTVDSFDSAVSSTNRGTQGNVASNSTAAGSVKLSGNATVKGKISVGPGGVTGNSPQAVVTKSGNASDLGQGNLDRPLEFPPVSPPASGTKDFNIKKKSDGSVAPGSYDELSASGGGQVVLGSGTYVFRSFKLSGNSTMSLNPTSGPVVVYVTETLDLTGGTVVNNSEKPSNLIFMLAPGVDAKLTGGSKAHMVVYGPKSDIKITGNADLFGTVVGRTVDITGNGNIHYDVDLARNPPPVIGTVSSGGFQVVSWQRF